jgi:hypothetical protein
VIKRKKKICKCCKTEQYLFAKGMCEPCYYVEFPKKPLKRTPIQQKPYTIPKVSDSQKKRNAQYILLRDEYLKTHSICECCNQNKSSEIHHKGGRIGQNLFINFLAVCRPCHQWIELHPEEAKDQGYSITRLNK